MRGPNRRADAEPQPFAGSFVVGDLDGQLILSDAEMPNPDDKIWLEYHPSQAITLDEFDEKYDDAAVWLAEPEPYQPRIPWIVPADEAARILGCKVAELDDWRRTVLPNAPRRFYGQADNEFRHEEVVAIAVGRWLRTTRQRNKRSADGFAARLALLPPAGDDWCVARKPRSKPSIVHGIATFDMEDRVQVPLVFNPGPIFEALRNRDGNQSS